MTSTEVYGNTLLIEIAVKDDRYLGLTLYNKNTVAIALNNLTLDEMPHRVRSRLVRHPNRHIVGTGEEEYSLNRGNGR